MTSQLLNDSLTWLPLGIYLCVILWSMLVSHTRKTLRAGAVAYINKIHDKFVITMASHILG